MFTKRFFALLLCFTLIFALFVPVNAIKHEYFDGIYAQDLKFTPDGGGKFIYVNNNEGILRSHITDSSNPTPEYIMKNEGLSSDAYSLYLSFINRTETRFQTTNVIDEQGFDIELDVEFYAKESSVLKINAIGFSVTDYDTYFENGVLTKKDRPWSCLTAVSDYTGRPIYQQNSSVKYFPRKFTPQSIKLKKGDTVWLSEFIENYRSVPWLKGVQILADVQIISGTMDINIAALRSKAALGDRSAHVKNAHSGKYYRDRQYKGIADTLPSVTSDVLSYTIDEYFVGGTFLPVTVYNQFQPDGNTLNKWFTHLNPQEDIWSRDLCAESDMLSFKYKDSSKLDYYGAFVREPDKDDVWVFDCFHSDTTNWDGEEFTGYKKSEYIPNYPLTTARENSGFGCNLGNYGVKTNYHLKIENTSGKTRYFNYHLKTTSDNLINVRDINGIYLTPYTVTKGQTDTKVLDTLACVELPDGKTTEFILEVTLPTNCAGGMENSFSVTDIPTEIVFEETKASPYLKKSNFTGSEYYKWENGELFISPDNKTFTKQEIDVKTTALFENKWNDYEIRRAGKGYTARCSAYLDTPSLYAETLKYFNNLYILDENFNVISQKQFDFFPIDVSYAFGKYYVSTKNGNFYSKDGVNWNEFLSGFSVPLFAENKNIAVAYKDKTLYITENGESFTPIIFAKNAPKYVDTIGEYFYYADKNELYLSENCVTWEKLTFEEDILSIGISNGKIVVNESKTIDIPKFKNEIMLNIKNKIVVPDVLPFISNNRTQVPVRALLENLGATVDFKADTREVKASLGEKEIALTIDSKTAKVDGKEITLDSPAVISNERTFVPLRFIAENLGFNVNWNPEERLIAVTEAKKEENPEFEELIPAPVLESGIIPDSETAKNVAFEILKGLGYDFKTLDVTSVKGGKAWNIKSPDFGLIMVISKENCEVLEFIEPTLNNNEEKN